MKYGTYSITNDRIARKRKKLGLKKRIREFFRKALITFLLLVIVGSSYFCTFVAGQLTANQAHAESAPEPAPAPKIVTVYLPAAKPETVPATKYSDAEISELRNILYSEIGNRSQEKRMLESRVVVSTVLNRLEAMKEHGATKETIISVLHQPNQYQGYNSKQYKIAASGKGNVKKLAAIDAVLDTLEDGTFKDTANGAFFYVHNPDGTIEYDDTRNLY